MEWPDLLQEKKVKEFSFYPDAYTPFGQESGFALPEVEIDLSGDDESDSDASSSQTPSWIKNLSFTIGGVTIGAAAVYGLWATTPPPPTPLCAVTSTPVSQTTQVKTPSATPTSSVGQPAGTPRSIPLAATSSSATGTSAQ